MKQNPYFLPALSACAGLSGLILRILLTLVGRDEKGLLVPTHPVALLLWLLTAAAVIGTVLQALRTKNTTRCGECFPPCPIAAMGCFVMAAGILLTLILSRSGELQLGLPRTVSTFLAVPALIWAGLCRRKGLRPNFLAYAAVWLYLTLHTIGRYQSWSSQPQILNFFFPMMGCLLMMLFAYCQTAFLVGLGSCRLLMGAGLLGGFFCLTAISGLKDMALYACGAVWLLTNLCRPVSREDSPKNPQ